MGKNTEVDFFKTTIPENIDYYLEHRGLSDEDVLGIARDGGVYYIFYKKHGSKDSIEKD